MKKQITLSLFAAILFVGGMFYSCSKEVVNQDDEIMLKSAKIKTTISTLSAPIQADCNTACIQSGGNIFYSKTYTLAYQAGPQGTATVAMYNTPTGMIYSVTSSTGSDLRLITLDGVVKYANNTPATEPFLISVPLGSNWVGCQNKSAEIEVRRVNDIAAIGKGNYLKFETSYDMISLCTETSIVVNNELPVCIGTSASVTGTVTAGSNVINGGILKIQELVGTSWTDKASVNVVPGTNSVTYSYTTVATSQTFRAFFDGINSNGNQSESLGTEVTTTSCAPSCEESFSYVTTDNKTVVFTYISPVALQGATVKITCPQIDGFTAIDGKNYNSNPGQSNGSDNVLTWTGNIPACGTGISFSFTFDPNCVYNINSKKWNSPIIWTDFTVNGYSKKGTLANIVFDDCNE